MPSRPCPGRSDHPSHRRPPNEQFLSTPAPQSRRQGSPLTRDVRTEERYLTTMRWVMAQEALAQSRRTERSAHGPRRVRPLPGRDLGTPSAHAQDEHLPAAPTGVPHASIDERGFVLPAQHSQRQARLAARAADERSAIGRLADGARRHRLHAAHSPRGEAAGRAAQDGHDSLGGPGRESVTPQPPVSERREGLLMMDHARPSPRAHGDHHVHGRRADIHQSYAHDPRARRAAGRHGTAVYAQNLVTQSICRVSVWLLASFVSGALRPSNHFTPSVEFFRTASVT